MADDDGHRRDQDVIQSREAPSTRYAALVDGDNARVTIYGSVKIQSGDYVKNSSPRPEEQEVQQAQLEFLEKVKRHLNKKWCEVQGLKSRPTAMIVEPDSGMKNVVEQSSDIAKNQLGRDIKEIDLEQIHDAMYNKPSRHAMVLGEAGAGKSTFLKMYSLAVSEGNVTALRDIKLVHFVDAAKLQFQTPSSAFHLFFIDRLAQYPDTKLTPDQAKAGQEWLENNSDKFLIAIDGLDQCLEDFSKIAYPEISEMTSAKANDLITNIMSGRIWHYARILTSSRWNIYWKLKSDQKPDKVIALRGFDDENLKTAALNLSTDGTTMLDQLRQTSPTFLAVCRIPMFLKYVATIYQSDRGSLPNSISGLMSAVFRNFLRLYGIDGFENITKLAYNGMLDNLYAIPFGYVKKLGIKPSDLNNFCSPGAILEKGCDNTTSHDTFYVFSHQTMQEFCCALHVLSLKKNEIEEFAATSLNESRMTLTRSLLYGLIMNDEVTDPMREYLNYRQTSIDDCRNILFAQLRCMIENGKLCDMQTIHMIRECGDDIVRQIKNDVHEIIINEGDLLQHDHMVLSTMTERLSPIREVWVSRFILQPSVIQCVKDCLRSADLFKIQKLFIFDKSAIEDECAELANLLHVTKCNEIRFINCDLNKNKMIALLKKCEKGNMKIQKLAIMDKSMAEDGYGALVRLLSVTKCNVLQLENCDLNKKKLEGLRKEFVNENVKIKTLVIIDMSMTEDGYGILAHLINVTKCNDLQLENCDLNKKKLNGLRQELANANVKIPKLFFCDKSMTADGYGQLANILSVTKCCRLSLINCDLNKNKLACLSEECQKGNVKIPLLDIRDKLMTADGYRELSNVINVTKCYILNLVHCDLNNSKLAEIFKECEYGNIKKMYFLNIFENHSTASDEEVSALCDLMTNSLCHLGLHDWIIDARGIQRLKETFQREASQMAALRLPNGKGVYKYPWMENIISSDGLIDPHLAEEVFHKMLEYIKT